MKVFFLAVAILLFAVVTQAQRQVRQANEVFDCVVTELVKHRITVTCDSHNPIKECKAASKAQDPACQSLILDIPRKSWFEFKEWRFETSADWFHEPPAQAWPTLRQILKGQWDENGHFRSVENCAARTVKAITEYCGGHYCRPPINSLVPWDCSGPRSLFIEALLTAK